MKGSLLACQRVCIGKQKMASCIFIVFPLLFIFKMFFHLSALLLIAWLSVVYELTDIWRASVSPFLSVAGVKETERFTLNLSSPNFLITSELSSILTDWQKFSENYYYLFTYKTQPLKWVRYKNDTHWLLEVGLLSQHHYTELTLNNVVAFNGFRVGARNDKMRLPGLKEDNNSIEKRMTARPKKNNNSIEWGWYLD